MLEWWNDGIVGIKSEKVHYNNKKCHQIHYSNIPFFHHSICERSELS